MTRTTDGFWEAPQLTLLSRPSFVEPTHLPVNWNTPTTEAEQIAEYAGRLCYMSQDNPAGRTTREYLTNIMNHGHGSVLEHVNFSVLVEGVSRSFTHELVRHRAGMAFSQLSQRYVNEEDCDFVIPPALLAIPDLLGAWKEARLEDRADYARQSMALMLHYNHIEDRTQRRKVVREATRSVLPNATETKVVVTGNLRAWRHIMTLRGNEGADAEMRRFAVAALNLLQCETPSLLGDFVVYQAADRFPAIQVGYLKV